MTAPTYANGVLDLRRTEIIPLIKLNIVAGDTFSKVIGVREIGVDYTGATASIAIYNGKPPGGELIYNDVTIPTHDVVVPATVEDLGSASFSIVIPPHITSTFVDYKEVFGACRLLMPDATITTIFTLNATIIYT
jgi:hypothetical protein